jgi:hypothetical protein
MMVVGLDQNISTVEAAMRLAVPLEIREVCPEEIREAGVSSRGVVSLSLALV